MGIRRTLAALLVLPLLTAASAKRDPGRVTLSFVVSSHNPTRNLSIAEARRIYLGETSRWRDGRRIVLLMPPPASPEGRLFLDRVVSMTDIDYSQWWISVVFRGELATPPRIVANEEAMLNAIAENADAIGFVATPPARSGVVAITIDGKSSEDAQYALKR